MVTISGNLPPKNVIAHVESTGARRRGNSSATTFFAEVRRRRQGRQRGECVGVPRIGLDEKEGEDTGADSDGRVVGTVNRQQAIKAPEMQEW